MSNVCAAIGRGQLTVLEKRIDQKNLSITNIKRLLRILRK